MDNEERELIVVAGCDGSGKRSFSECFKNSFLQSLPYYPLYQGIVGGMSFSTMSDLTDPTDLSFLLKAYKAGYRITLFFLFTGKLVASQRARFRTVVTGEPFSETSFKKSYEDSYKGLISIAPLCTLIFAVRNAKYFEFLSAFEAPQIESGYFEKAVKAIKKSVDEIA